MLLWNRFVWTLTPDRKDCGYPFMGVHSNYFRQNNLSRYYGEGWHSAAEISSTPVGLRPPYQFLLAPKAGGISTTGKTISCSADMSMNLAAGINMTATIPCTAEFAASQLQTVISMTASIAASGSITGSLVAFMNMTANITASGDLSADMSALSSMVANLQAAASMSNNMNATANMTADITPFTELSPQSLSEAVWNSIASAYNESGTMGQKLNAAGTAGDPWTTDLDAYTTEGTAGKLMKDKLSTDDFLALK